MEEMCNTCSEEELRFFTGLARKLWFHRNKYIHGGPFIHPTTLVQQVCRAMADYMTANETIRTNPRQKHCESWKAPGQGWVKLNWDIMLCDRRGLVGMGAVIRNEEGRVLAVQCSVTVGFLEPTVAGAWVGDQALQFGKELGFTHLVLEGDSKVIIDAIKSEDFGWSTSWHLVRDMKSRLQTFEQWQLR
jgi:hypothetical protein